MSLKEFMNILVIKNQLINAPVDNLLEIYSNDDNFKELLNGLISIIENENIFLALDDNFSCKIYAILNDKDEEFDDITISKINYISRFLESIECCSQLVKNIKINAYSCYEEDIRGASFKSHNDFLQSIAYDANVLNSILRNDFSYVEKYDLFIYSLSSIINTIPGLFKNEIILNNTMNRLNYMSKRLNVNSKTYTIKIGHEN